MKTARFTTILTLTALLTAVPVTAQILGGVYYGNQGWAMDDVQRLEDWQGQQNAVVNMFTNWDGGTKVMNNLFDMQLPNIWNNGNVPMITWEPSLKGTTPDDIEVRIAAGDHDAYIQSWASRLKTFLAGPDGTYGNADDRRAYLRLGHEMNGDWYPWGAAIGANSPADYVAMWQHVVLIFDAEGLDSTRLQWVWCVNHTDNGGYAAEGFYPGDAWVDWVAVDGYNWGDSQAWSTWLTPAETYGDMFSRIAALTSKPLAVTEFGTTSSPLGVAGKSLWLADVFAYFTVQGVGMTVYFNEDKETDWAVYGGTGGDGTHGTGRFKVNVYSAYATAMQTWTIGPDASNPRLLTDAQFAGQ